MPIKQRIIVFSIVITVIIILLIITITQPLKNKTLLLKQELINAENNSTSEQDEARELLMANQTFKNIETSKIESVFLQKKNTIDFINILENIAKQNNCEIVLDLQEMGSESSADNFNAQINVIGEFNNIINFINDLEQENFYVNYNSISLSRNIQLNTNNGISNASTRVISANLNVQTFWQ